MRRSFRCASDRLLIGRQYPSPGAVAALERVVSPWTSDGVPIVLQVTSAVGSEIAVAGPFVARVRVGGEEVRGCLADLPLDLLRRCEPVRSPGVYRRQRHMPGRWFSTTTGGFLEYESLLERDWMLLLDFDRQVEWICEQPRTCIT